MNLKKLLPFENYEMVTSLTVDEVLKRIKDNMDEKKDSNFSFSVHSYTKAYVGKIIGSSFVMSRNINYKNSFLPVITGDVFTSLGKTTVHVKMQPIGFVLVFISIWLSVVGFACLAIIFGGFFSSKNISQNGFSPAILIPFIMFLFGSLLTYFAFKVESKKSKKFLANLLEEENI